MLLHHGHKLRGHDIRRFSLCSYLQGKVGFWWRAAIIKSMWWIIYYRYKRLSNPNPCSCIRSCKYKWRHLTSNGVNRWHYHHIHHCLLDNYLQRIQIKHASLIDHWWNPEIVRFTCASNIGAGTGISISCFADANDCITASIVRADGIDIATSVLYFAAIYDIDAHVKWGMLYVRYLEGKSEHLASIEKNLPVQTTMELDPVFVYPVLQVHWAALLVSLWEQIALASQPPLLTRQVSRASKGMKKIFIEECHFWVEWNKLTCTDCFSGLRRCVGVSSFARAYHGIGCAIVRTFSIDVASTVIDFAIV